MAVLKLHIPEQIMQRLREIEEKYRIPLQDVLLRALLKTIEEFERAEEGETP